MKQLRLFLLLLTLTIPAAAQHEAGEKYFPEQDPVAAEKIRQWQDLKFGLLMHWGPYSQWGIVESWSICPEEYDWCRRVSGSNPADYQTYLREYEGLQRTFNPVKFDPARWARAARDAGMKYVVFTTKHHDGFCMFDSKNTDYKVTDPKCPFSADPKKNIAKEIFDAFRSEGLWTGAYFSKPDWHCPFYWDPKYPPRDRNVNYEPEANPEQWNRYVEFTHNQVMELLTGYGKIDILWFDGGWVAKTPREEIVSWYRRHAEEAPNGYLKNRIVNQDVRMDDLVSKARRQQPGIIVVDRAVPGKNQNYLTPENQVPGKPLPWPWESCIISGGGWSYTPDAVYMTGRKGIHLLVDIVAKGGNLLLNVAPSPEGEWQPGAYGLLKEYADWMKVNGEGIYGTRPLEPCRSGNVCMTAKPNGDRYFIYLSGEGETTLPESIVVESPPPARGARVVLLGSGRALTWKPEGAGFRVEIPGPDPEISSLPVRVDDQSFRRPVTVG